MPVIPIPEFVPRTGEHMMRGPVLISGSPPSLIIGLAGRYLTATDADIVLLGGDCHQVDRVLGRVAEPGRRAAGRRLRHVPVEPGAAGADATPRPHGTATIRAEEVCCLAIGSDDDRDVAADVAHTRLVLDMLPELGTTRLCFVGPAPSDVSGGAAAARADLEAEVRARTGDAAVSLRVVRTEPAVSAATAFDELDEQQGAVLSLLSAVESVQAELDDRAPGYLPGQPLRLSADPGDVVGLIATDDLIGFLLTLSDPGETARSLDVVSRHPVPMAELCWRVGTVYGVELLAIPDDTLLNPVDRLLADRMGGSGGPLAKPPPAVGRRSGGPGGAGLDGPALSRLATSMHSGQRARRRSADMQATALARQRPLTVAGRDGTPFPYLTSGSIGPPLVVLNALGQSTVFWHRLMSRLAPRRVLVWQPTGVYGDSARTVTLAGQADDVEAVLDHEGIESCHLVAWCTGPRVALQVYYRRPDAVQSMVFLNASMKHIGHDDGLDTPYERNLEYVCRTLHDRPELAGRLLGLLATGASDGPDMTTADVQVLGDAVLRTVSPLLRPEVRRPFADAPTLVRYATQLLDLWSHDPLAGAERVRTPVLCLGAEYDDIASPQRFRERMPAFPDSRHVTIRGATHYLLHDRADEVARLINEFLRATSRSAPRSAAPPAATEGLGGTGHQ